MRVRLAGMLASGLVLAAVSAASAQTTGEDPVARCDALAASPFDTSDPARKGVGLDDLIAPPAIEACIAATKAVPDEPRMHFQLGRALDKAGRFKEAFAEYTIAADLGSLLAVYSLGSMYRYGDGVAQDDVKAAELFRKASDAGLALASAELGWMIENGLGTAKDDVEATRLHRIGAEAGIDVAQNNLAVMYEQGRGGLPKDPAKAIEFYRLAAAKGHGLAAANLGGLYAEGRGVKRDSAEGERFFRAAIGGGDKDVANDARNGLAWLLAVDDRKLAEAEALALEAVGAKPKAANFQDTLAYVLYRRGKFGLSLAAQREAIKLQPDHAHFHARLGDILDSLGQDKNAEAAWRDALALTWDGLGDEAFFKRETYEAKLAEAQ